MQSPLIALVLVLLELVFLLDFTFAPHCFVKMRKCLHESHWFTGGPGNGSQLAFLIGSIIINCFGYGL